MTLMKNLVRPTKRVHCSEYKNLGVTGICMEELSKLMPCFLLNLRIIDANSQFAYIWR